MPELPEVETTRRGITPHICNSTISKSIIRRYDLRWPIPRDINKVLKNQTLHDIERRAKYLLLRFDAGTLMIHLGMSGKLFIASQNQPVAKHDHVDLAFQNGSILRFNDARRFGSIHWFTEPDEQHFLLNKLGPEPLLDDFHGNHLFARSRGKQVPVKSFIMDNKHVVGVGNIYASEALFRSGILPNKPAGKISKAKYHLLASHIKDVLNEAIDCGGTTLKDYANGENKPGYFKVNLAVYGREDEPCLTCGKPVRRIIIGQRSTYFCQHCQH